MNAREYLPSASAAARTKYTLIVAYKLQYTASVERVNAHVRVWRIALVTPAPAYI